MAIYAIGDVHGCYNELNHLLDKINFCETTDSLWFVGDLINRGPKSLKTLRFIYGLPNTHVVLGNHELSLLATAYAGLKPSKNDNFKKILKADDSDELLHWIRHQKLFHRDKALGFAMVHAGLHPSWSLKKAGIYAKEVEQAIQSPNHAEFLSQMFGNKPDEWSDELTGHERLRCLTNIFTRMRYCTQDGKLNLKLKSNPSKQTKGKYLPWFDVLGRKSAKHKIIFGHWSTLGLVHRKNVYAIDTGCLWGGSLTALRIDTDMPEITQVPSIKGINPIK